MAITLSPRTLHRLLASLVSCLSNGGPTRSAISPRPKRRARPPVVRRPVPLRICRRTRPLLPRRVPEPPLAAHHQPATAHARLRLHVRPGPGHRRPVPARRRPDALLPPPVLRPALVPLHVAVRRVRRGHPPRQPRRAARLPPPPLALLLALATRARPLTRRAPCRPALAVPGLLPAPAYGAHVRQPPVVISAGALGDGQHDNRTVCFAGGIRTAGQRVPVPGVAAPALRVRYVRALVQPTARPQAPSRHPHRREAVLLQRRVREDVHAEGRAQETPAREALWHRRECLKGRPRILRPLLYTH